MVRPKRTLLDQAATQTWFSAVSAASGLKTAYQLEKHFAAAKSTTGDAAIGRSCQWDKYRRGLNTPSKKTRDRVEKEFPGTRQWLEHPIWEMCSDSHPTNQRLSMAIGLVRPKLANHVGQSASLSEGRNLSYAKSIHSLRYQADLAALVALLAIVRDGEAKEDTQQIVDAIHASALVGSLLLTRHPLNTALIPLMRHLCGKYFSVILYDRLPPFSSAEEAIHFVEVLALLVKEGVKSKFISKNNQDEIALTHWAYQNLNHLRVIDRRAYSTDPVVVDQVNQILEDNAREGWLKNFYRTRWTSGSSPYFSQGLRLAFYRSIYGSKVSAERLFEFRRQNQLIPKNM